jgi:PST family polysaccharide transporter
MINQFKSLANTENKKRLIHNFFSLIVLRGFQFLIPLITLPYLVRTIGIENFGLINFAMSLGLYFGAFIQFGFGITATREISRQRDDDAKIAQIFSSTFTASLILAGLCAVIFFVVVLCFDKFNDNMYLYLTILAYIIFQSLFPVWFFQGMEKMKYITLLNLVTSMLFLIGLFVFVKQQQDYLLVPVLNAIAALAMLGAALAVIKKGFGVNFVMPTKNDVMRVYSDGRYAFISQFAPNLYNNSAVFLLGIFAGNTAVGLYTAATKVIDVVISFAYILSNTFFPYLSRNLQRHKAFQKIMLSSGFVLTAVTFLMAEWITTLLFSAANIEVANYIRWLAVSIILLFTTMTYSTNYLMLIGKESLTKNISLYTSLVFFCVALITIPLLGISGAIGTLVIARFFLALINFSFYFKYRHLGDFA